MGYCNRLNTEADIRLQLSSVKSNSKGICKDGKTLNYFFVNCNFSQNYCIYVNI